MGSALCPRPLTLRWEVVLFVGVVVVWWVAVVPFVAFIAGVAGMSATNRTSSGREVVVLVWQRVGCGTIRCVRCRC